ncbi:cation:proton antiporter, partial [Burkholderia thailandensis]|nr:cation:proton antiporter [Burkholderia thailandensis]
MLQAHAFLYGAQSDVSAYRVYLNDVVVFGDMDSLRLRRALRLVVFFDVGVLHITRRMVYGGHFVAHAPDVHQGVVVGFVVGKLVVWFLKLLDDDYLVITVAVIAGWIAYIAGEMVEVSGVIATVTAGMIIGWHQHEVFSAAVRTRGTAFWQVIVFLLEAMVFVLIGLSLRGAIHRLGGFEQVLGTMMPAVLAVLAAVIVSRFVWVYAVEVLKWPVRGIVRRGGTPD